MFFSPHFNVNIFCIGIINPVARERRLSVSTILGHSPLSSTAAAATAVDQEESLPSCSEPGRSRSSPTERRHTANEGPERIQYKCLVPIYEFPEMKLLFPKQNYTVLSPSSYTHAYVRDLYISRIGLPVLLQGNMWTDPGNM
jgi:hypothetical protein